ncbi:kinase-like domain-containing protein, partial [Coprinopsis sp. MPI-PUGE-AT-0042]
LLDIDTLKPFRAVFLRGLLRFAKAIGKFPRGLIYNDVVVVESGTAITAGAFGDVWRGVLRGQSVAMKVMRTIKRPEEILRNCSKEAVVWSQLRHPNVLPFYGIYYWTPHSSMALQRMALLSPWLDAGNAVDYLRHHLDVDKESLILDIAQGLNYLHAFQPAIVHGDLKGNNILINSEGRACLADFGLSKLVRDEDWVTSPGDSSTFHGCQYFSAPELLFWELDQDERETSSDVYAFGCVCYQVCNSFLCKHYSLQKRSQLYTGKPRFFDLNIMDRLLAIRGNKRCRRPSEMSDKLWENVEACWSTLPQERPAMAHFVQSLAIENDTEVGLGDHSCDSPSGGLVWDGRTNPHVPLDIFQLTCRSSRCLWNTFANLTIYQSGYAKDRLEQTRLNQDHAIQGNSLV